MNTDYFPTTPEEQKKMLDLLNTIQEKLPRITSFTEEEKTLANLMFYMKWVLPFGDPYCMYTRYRVTPLGKQVLKSKDDACGLGIHLRHSEALKLMKTLADNPLPVICEVLEDTERNLLGVAQELGWITYKVYYVADGSRTIVQITPQGWQALEQYKNAGKL